MTCSGSATRDVLVGGQYLQNAQIRTLTAQTRLVMLTVGGNDVGFVRDLYLLAARNSDTWFGWAVRELWVGSPKMEDCDFPKLAVTLQSLIRELHRRSPKARIVVATYPAVLPPYGTCPQLGLSASNADIMRTVQDALAATTGRIAREEGTTIVDMTTIGADHSACYSTPWTRGRGSISKAPFTGLRQRAMLSIHDSRLTFCTIRVAPLCEKSCPAMNSPASKSLRGSEKT